AVVVEGVTGSKQLFACLGISRRNSLDVFANGIGSRLRAAAARVGKLRRGDVPDRSQVDERRLPQAEAAQRIAGGEFDLDPAHVIGTAANRVAEQLFRILGGGCFIVIADAKYTRADAANVEAAQLRTEKAIGEADGTRI